MKKSFRKVLAAFTAVGLFALAGCSNVIGSDDGEYGSLVINGKEARALSAELKASIKTAVVTITADDISTPVEKNDVTISNGAADSVVISGIKAGRNRVVTVTGKDDSGNDVTGAVLRAVTNINKGNDNSVTVNWTSSKKGYVYDALLKGGVNISELEEAACTELDSHIPSCDATNIKLSAFVTDYKANALKSAENYIESSDKVLKRVTVSEADGSTAAAPAFKAVASFSVGDDVDVTSEYKWSSDKTTVATVGSTTGKVTLVAAGEAKVTGSYTFGNVTKSGAGQTLTVTAGGDITGKTIIFVKAGSAPCIWCWEDGGKAISQTGLNLDWNTEKANPNKSKMTAATTEYMASPSGWYMYDVTDYVTAGNSKVIKFILNWGSEITGKAGTFWYDGSSCSTTNPSPVAAGLSATIDSEPVVDPLPPTVTIAPATGKVSTTGNITVTIKENNATVTAATVTVSGAVSKTYSLSDFVNNVLTISVKALGITEADKVIQVSASATNSEGSGTATAALETSAVVVAKDTFTWDNALMYFVIQDRFYNGNTSNDNGYNRKGNSEANASSIGTFHGGDIAGLTQKLDYLNDLGINALWITAPYEQAHGWTGGGDNGDFAHFAYHGYYPLDYTMMDKNMGTVEEFRTFVTECHKRGIRVVMDVVMNHTGYLTFKDMKDYSIFPFSRTWSGFDKNDDNLGYTKNYGKSEKDGVVSDNKTFHGHHYYIDYSSGNSEWNKWWGSSWVRAGVGGSYTGGGNDELTQCLNGLPDVKSENTTAQGIPPILNTKWNTNKEATSADYAAWRVPAADNLRKDLNVAPMVYIEKWLAAWVEEFGIDGFRCDTAKHVNHYRWKELDNLCETALKNWRKSSRADEYAKDWDEEFFMTGEAFGWTSGGDWFSNGFDSMIDFSIANREGMGTYSPSLPDWSSRAGNKQGLLYISSHDTGLGRWSDQKSLGTKLVLMPGEVQIYYGDETNRSFGETGSDKNQGTRSDFNWDAANGDCANHWKKLGTFRKHNEAVGAGSVNGDVRTCGDNKVVINTSSNSVSVPYANGTTVYNWYDGTSATVSNGMASFTSSVSYTKPLLVSDRNPADYGVTF